MGKGTRSYRIDPQVAHDRAKKAGLARTTVEHHVDKVVEAWPELTDEQKARIEQQLRPGVRHPDTERGAA